MVAFLAILAFCLSAAIGLQSFDGTNTPIKIAQGGNKPLMRMEKIGEHDQPQSEIQEGAQDAEGGGEEAGEEAEEEEDKKKEEDDEEEEDQDKEEEDQDQEEEESEKEKEEEGIVVNRSNLTNHTHIHTQHLHLKQVVPRPPREGKIKSGWCANWEEGSSIVHTGDMISFFGSHHDLTEAACFDKCDNERVCEQAVYAHNSSECFLGINSMEADPSADSVHTCYAKHGFKYKKELAVKDGWCNEWTEGWARGSGARQCNLEDITPNAQLSCSHWGPEYALSELGCWQLCRDNQHCTQAVYEVAMFQDLGSSEPPHIEDNSWHCFIGVHNMTANPGTNRDFTKHAKCFAKNGFQFSGHLAGGGGGLGR